MRAGLTRGSVHGVNGYSFPKRHRFSLWHPGVFLEVPEEQGTERSLLTAPGLSTSQTSSTEGGTGSGRTVGVWKRCSQTFHSCSGDRTSFHAYTCILVCDEVREAAGGVEVVLGMSAWFEALLSLGSVSFAGTALPVCLHWTATGSTGCSRGPSSPSIRLRGSRGRRCC